MRGIHIGAGAAIVALVIGLLGWLILAPGWAVPVLQEQVQLQLGRKLDVKGGARLVFSPSLAIQMDHVSLAAATDQEGPFITAKAIRIPVGFGQLISRNADFSKLTLESAEFAFLIDERSQVTWGFAGVKSPHAITIGIENGAMRFFDARNGQSFALSGASGSVDIGADGDLYIKGTAEIGGRLARIQAFIKSLQRIHADGSPLDITVETAEMAAVFNGRIATAKVLDLAGPVSITGPNLRAAARWAGLAVAEGANYRRFAVAGGLDSAGRAFAIRSAAVELDDLKATGDMALDFRGGLPKLQAALVAPSLILEAFLPDSGAKPDAWGSIPLGFKFLRVLDAEITVQTPAFFYGQMVAGPARIVATLSNGKLDSSIVLQTASSGNATISSTLDTATSPPVFSMTLKSENINAKEILPGLANIAWLSGKGSINASLSGVGQTQQEIIGTLKGNAELSLTEGEIEGINIVTALGAVSQRILQGWLDGGMGNTAFASLSVSAIATDGIVNVENLKLESPALVTGAKGEVDLLRRAVDLRADPRLRTGADGVTTGLPVSVVVKGPWANPKIYPDMKGILLDPPTAFETLKTIGLTTGN